MLSIYKKEMRAFFSSLIGYVVIGLFLIIIGLFMWVFPDYSVLDYGYSTMEQLFSIAPWVFTFLVPAITMRMFAEEFQTGTIEFLNTKPVGKWSIVLGKYFAALSLVVFALIPTVLYYYSLYQLGSPVGNLDSGGILGSYIGLLFLAAAFTAIGLFASALTTNQIVAFLLSTFLCFMLYWAFLYISKLPVFYGKTDDIVQMIGMDYHYNSMSRGVIELKDVVYFLSIIFLFWNLTLYRIGHSTNR